MYTTPPSLYGLENSFFIDGLKQKPMRLENFPTVAEIQSPKLVSLSEGTSPLHNRNSLAQASNNNVSQQTARHSNVSSNTSASRHLTQPVPSLKFSDREGSCPSDMYPLLIQRSNGLTSPNSQLQSSNVGVISAYTADPHSFKLKRRKRVTVAGLDGAKYSLMGKRIGRPRIDRENTRCHECLTITTPQWRYILTEDVIACSLRGNNESTVTQTEVADEPLGCRRRRSPFLSGIKMDNVGTSRTSKYTGKICLCNACWLRVHKAKQRLKREGTSFHEVDSSNSALSLPTLDVQSFQLPPKRIALSVNLPISSAKKLSKALQTENEDFSIGNTYAECLLSTVSEIPKAASGGFCCSASAKNDHLAAASLQCPGVATTTSQYQPTSLLSFSNNKSEVVCSDVNLERLSVIAESLTLTELQQKVAMENIQEDGNVCQNEVQKLMCRKPFNAEFRRSAEFSGASGSFSLRRDVGKCYSNELGSAEVHSVPCKSTVVSGSYFRNNYNDGAERINGLNAYSGSPYLRTQSEIDLSSPLRISADADLRLLAPSEYFYHLQPSSAVRRTADASRRSGDIVTPGAFVYSGTAARTVRCDSREDSLSRSEDSPISGSFVPTVAPSISASCALVLRVGVCKNQTRKDSPLDIPVLNSGVIRLPSENSLASSSPAVPCTRALSPLCSPVSTCTTASSEHNPLSATCQHCRSDITVFSGHGKDVINTLQEESSAIEDKCTEIRTVSPIEPTPGNLINAETTTSNSLLVNISEKSDETVELPAEVTSATETIRSSLSSSLFKDPLFLEVEQRNRNHKDDRVPTSSPPLQTLSCNVAWLPRPPPYASHAILGLNSTSRCAESSSETIRTSNSEPFIVYSVPHLSPESIRGREFNIYGYGIPSVHCGGDSRNVLSTCEASSASVVTSEERRSSCLCETVVASSQPFYRTSLVEVPSSSPQLPAAFEPASAIRAAQFSHSVVDGTAHPDDALTELCAERCNSTEPPYRRTSSECNSIFFNV